MNLVLIGYRGTGKSSLAQMLAARLGWKWVDTDALVEAQAGCSIAEIFARQGEPAFRDLESAALARLAASDRTVVATGGGIVLREANRSVLRALGPVVWLMATPQTILARLAQDPTTRDRRPNLTPLGGAAEIEQLLAARRPLYGELARFAVDTDERTPGQLADEILAHLFPDSAGAR